MVSVQSEEERAKLTAEVESLRTILADLDELIQGLFEKKWKKLQFIRKMNIYGKNGRKI
jgi:hypothetical protein